MKYTPKEVEENVNISFMSPVGEFFVLLAGILGVLIVIYVAFGLSIELVVPRIPRKMEKELERLFLKNYEIVEKTPSGERLQQLLDNLAKELSSSEMCYKVHLIERPQANALALPGGNIIVFSAILEDVGSENGLAFVLSHELGHFYNRDHLRGLGRALILWSISTVLLGHDSFITQFLAGSLINIEMKFSQRQEIMADLFAVDLLNKRYGHVGGAEGFLKNISRKEKKGRLFYYFASHPHPKDRIETMDEYIRKKGYQREEPIPLCEDFRFSASKLPGR